MALTILTGSSQAAGINYSYRTSGSADWSSVPTASYFYDIIDKTVRYKSLNGDIQRFDTFPFTGSALITGSLGVTGSASILATTSTTSSIFNVRNSASTANLLTVKGNSDITLLTENPVTSGGILIEKASNYFEGSLKFYSSFGTHGITLDNTINTIRANNLRAGSVTGNGYMGLIESGSQIRFLKHVDVFGNEYISLGGSNYDGSGGISFTLKTTTTNGTNFVTFSRSNNTNPFVINDQAYTKIGTSTPAARLDVRAQGALSTDIAFRVRNSADTANILTVNGDGTIIIPTTPKIDTTSGTFLQTNNFGSFTFGSTNSSITGLYDISCFGSNNTLNNAFDSYCILGRNNNVAGMRNIVIGNYNKTSGDTSMRIGHSYGQDTFGGNSSMHFGRAGGGGFLTYSANEVTNFFFNDWRTSQMFRGNGSILLSGKNSQILTDANVTTFMGDGGNTLVVRNHTNVPSTNVTDSFQQYSADIVAGNAAPHFRTENGSIIKLYKEIQPALSGSANTGDPATDALIEAMKTIILNLGFGASS